MGVELHPVFRPAISDLVYRAEGKALIHDLEALEAIASGRGATPLSTFMDPREPPDDFEPDEDFDGDPETYLEQACGPWTDWFPASDGLRAVRGLLEAIREESGRRLLSDPETVEFDLEELGRCLESAAHRKGEFRLAVV